MRTVGGGPSLAECWAMRLPLLLVCALVGCSGGGAHAHVVPLLSAAGMPHITPPPPDTPLEVITKSTAVREPLPVRGSSFAYADVEATLGHAVASSTVPW